MQSQLAAVGRQKEIDVSKVNFTRVCACLDFTLTMLTRFPTYLHVVLDKQ
jgi:hypothetical protein